MERRVHGYAAAIVSGIRTSVDLGVESWQYTASRVDGSLCGIMYEHKGRHPLLPPRKVFFSIVIVEMIFMIFAITFITPFSHLSPYTFLDCEVLTLTSSLIFKKSHSGPLLNMEFCILERPETMRECHDIELLLLESEPSPDSGENDLFSIPSLNLRLGSESPSDTTRTLLFGHDRQVKPSGCESSCSPADRDSLSSVSSAASEIFSKKARRKRELTRASSFECISIAASSRRRSSDQAWKIQNHASFISFALELFPWVVSIVWVITLLLAFPP